MVERRNLWNFVVKHESAHVMCVRADFRSQGSAELVAQMWEDESQVKHSVVRAPLLPVEERRQVKEVTYVPSRRPQFAMS